MKKKIQENMTKESERLNIRVSLLWFFQLLAEWVLQLQSHIQKTGISPGHKALTTV